MTRPILLTLALAIAALAATGPAASAQAPAPCPASFHVLHDDRIGDVQLPAGVYRLQTTEISCARSAILFAEFLKDYNGLLPRPWRYSVRGQGVLFTRGGGDQGFTATRTGDATAATPGPIADGGGSHGDLLCPSTFRVLHNDKIGPMTVIKGQYRITLLGGTLSCATATRQFARFLRDTDGNLGGGWTLLPLTGEFVDGSTHNGFRIKSVDDPI